MIETAIAAGIVVVLLAVVVAPALAPLAGLLAVGVATILVGLVLGVPGSIGYHVTLWRALRSRAALSRRWWLSPTSLHPRLTVTERRRVLPWFYLGAGGFTLIMLGSLLMLAAAMPGAPVP